MKIVLTVLAAVVLFLVGAGSVTYFYLRQSNAPGKSEKLAALRELRDTGVITPEEYDARVQSAGAPAPVTSTPVASTPAASGMGAVVKAAFAGTRKVEVSDPVYQTRAYTLEIPGDWKFAGDIVRAGGCHSNGASLRFTAQSPDGLSASIVLPGVAWSWWTSESRRKTAEQMHCPGVDIDTAASFLVNIAVPNIRPKAKIVEVLPVLPEGQAALKAQLEKAQEQNAQMARQYGAKPQKLTMDGARVRVTYERDGHAVEELIAVVIDCTESSMPALYNQPAYQQRMCTSRGTTIARAPAGRLDGMTEQLKTLSRSLQANPEWQSRLRADQQAAFQRMQAENNRQFQAMMKKGRDDNDALLARGRAFDQGLRESTDRALAADRARQAAIDESAHRTALYSLDRQEFRNPNTGQVIEASNQYNHQWLSSDGSTLIQTNDHAFDPNGLVNPISQSWTELVAK